jgi:hypothetical protein
MVLTMAQQAAVHGQRPVHVKAKVGANSDLVQLPWCGGVGIGGHPLTLPTTLTGDGGKRLGLIMWISPDPNKAEQAGDFAPTGESGLRSLGGGGGLAAAEKQKGGPC